MIELEDVSAESTDTRQAEDKVEQQMEQEVEDVEVAEPPTKKQKREEIDDTENTEEESDDSDSDGSEIEIDDTEYPIQPELTEAEFKAAQAASKWSK